MSIQSNSSPLSLHTCPCYRQGTTESAIRLMTRDKASPPALIFREWASNQPVTSDSGNPLPSEPSLQSLERTLSPRPNRGVLTMWFPLHRSPSFNADEAALHRGKAIRALRGNKSVFIRLARYNRHMATARILEAKSASGQPREIPKCSPPSSTQNVGGPI
jgi:hypothetical protein